jgi:hypothetical protein
MNKATDILYKNSSRTALKICLGIQIGKAY